ncbi:MULTISPECIES: zinc-dependent alcohol dehydrogenase [Rhizobium/Agrobacterium group]|uniref:zinc-dependent alcohol dehydrogenase n=1 Tax=Rhizobium oryzihabitans TaxID=2267833 RepID=UPI00403398B9
MNATTGRVMRLVEPYRLVEEEVLLSEPRAGEILCETLVSAISPGTELAAYTGMPPLRPGPAYPRLQGYCNIARVIAVGEGGNRVATGDRVLTFQSHRSHFLLPEADVLARIDDGLGSEEASVAYLFHLGYNAVLRSNTRAGHRVAVVGLGALGLGAVAMAALAGAKVTAISEQEDSCRLALAMGADNALSRDATIVQIDAGLAVDIVISTSGSWEDWQLALKLAAQMGVIAVLGFPGRGLPPPLINPLDSQYFYMKQLRIEAVGMSPELPDTRGFARFNERSNLEFILSRILNGTVRAGRIVSGRFPGTATGLSDAYAALLARKGAPVTYTLDWSMI